MIDPHLYTGYRWRGFDGLIHVLDFRDNYRWCNTQCGLSPPVHDVLLVPKVEEQVNCLGCIGL